jgi:hypothetical protein
MDASRRAYGQETARDRVRKQTSGRLGRDSRVVAVHTLVNKQRFHPTNPPQRPSASPHAPFYAFVLVKPYSLLSYPRRPYIR